MKKRIITVVIAIIMAIGLTACNQASDKSDDTTDYITEEEVKKTALNHAGFAEDEVVFTRVNLDLKEEPVIYEVEFYYDDREYDYDIDALSGEIIGYDNDMEGRTRENAGQDIGEAAARALVMEKADGVDEAEIVIQRNTNDGEPIYRGTVAYGAKNYEFEIDAVNGTIARWEEY